ncbi:MAG: signal peptidase II [Holosporaceae bacterium]|nr:signal peptidase II [Holosporaceae bacterium]
MPKSFSSTKLATFLAFLVIAVDQSSKWAVLEFLERYRLVRIFPFFNITVVKNTGISFGVFSETVHPIILILVSTAVAVSLVLWTSNNIHYRLPTVLITSGAIGNILDRIFYGYVVDFLDFHICSYHWPAFNIADAVVVVGAALLVLVTHRCGDWR